ncbi:hypothetical protein [Brevundimonas sp. R86498]|uniref:hypothetical protein n=1 Tax=Brevundimonas sp. R86498 TaxID=3093845 RepID=UPI0037C5B2D3
MKALVVLVHYFASEPNPRHSSVDEARRVDRTNVVQRVVRGYRGAFGPSAEVRYARKQSSYVLDMACPVDLDLRILTVPGHSLLDQPFRDRFGVAQTSAQPTNPRMLGFDAYRVFAKHADQYDWFIYSEDDLLVRDPLFFDKLIWFNRTFGDRRVLSPNRFEWNDQGKTQKTWIDHDLEESVSRSLLSAIDDEETLTATPLSTPTTFRRANNPHSGFFAINATQLAHWMSRPHWLDRDASFVSPLESAATLGLARTFSVYKPAGRAAGFLEIEHLDNRFSGRARPLTILSTTGGTK